MSILVVGSVAFDSLETPFGKAEKVIGGAATYFSVAASYFTPVQLVAVVGDDFTEEHEAVFHDRDIDLSGLERVSGGKTFHWSGEYGYDMNIAITRATELNVFADFKPRLPEHFRDPRILFLANIHPELQLDVLRQAGKPDLIALDTMNYWISSAKDALLRVIAEVDLLVVNEAEVRQLTGETNLVKGARAILDLGPKTLVIKRGEYGVLLFTEHHLFAAPAYPLESVFDPTGAGDTFAGGFLGSLATSDLSDEAYKQAIIHGTVLASYNVEAFSLDRLRALTQGEISNRYRDIHRLTQFKDIDIDE